MAIWLIKARVGLTHPASASPECQLIRWTVGGLTLVGGHRSVPNSETKRPTSAHGQRDDGLG